MSNIIMACVGNRNIKYDDKNIDNQNYRDITKKILDNFDTEKTKIREEIISRLIKDKWNQKNSQDFLEPYTDKPTQFDKLYLFCSNSYIIKDDKKEYNSSDTIYSGEIIKKLFAEDPCFSTISVEIITIGAQPTDEDDIMKSFSGKLKKLNLSHEDRIVMLLQGGLPAYKVSLKLQVEFLFDNPIFLTVPNNKADITVQTNQGYRDIINQEQTDKLLEKGHIEDAFNILSDKNEFKDFLKFVAHLFKYDIQNAFNVLPNVKQKIRNIIPKEIIEKAYYGEPKWDINKDEYFNFCVLLDIAAFYKNKKNYNFAVMYYHITIEVLVNYFLINKLQFNENAVEGKYEDGWSNRLNELKKTNDYLINLPDKLTLKKPNLPSKCYIVSSCLENTEVKAFFSNILSNINSDQSISKLRNKFCHTAKSISEKDFTSQECIFNTCHTFLNDTEKKENIFNILISEYRKIL